MESDHSDFVNVLICEEEQSEACTSRFSRARLCSSSRFFQKAFDGGSLEATTSEVFINDISVEHLGLFADWIMKGCIAINHTLGDLIQLYIMADQFDVKELRTRITDELAYVCYEIDFSLPERGVITLIVDNIPESMPLHRLLAKAVARLLSLLLSTSQVAVAAHPEFILRSFLPILSSLHILGAGLRYYPRTQPSFPNILHPVLGAGLRQNFCTLPYFAIILLPLPNHSSIYPLFYANHALREDSSVSVELVIFFIVSRQRLCRVSKFFNKAFSGSFLESHTGTLDLYEVSTYYFGLFLEWVTTGQLPTLSLRHMVQLYVLGDKYDAPEFRQCITDSLTNHYFGPRFVVPTSETIDLLLRNVPWSPPLKSLLANAVVRFAYFNPIRLSPSESSEMVDELLEKPYGGLTNFGRSPYTAWRCPFPPCVFSPP
ncbi:hypothetical protein JADG_002460 [Aureobasidium aubasidani]|nr:hypothetical protein JADG_002460 [Aureobasidium pullulans]